MTYTQTYTRPFGAQTYTGPTRPTRFTLSTTYTHPYTTYTRMDLHVSGGLYIETPDGGPVEISTHPDHRGDLMARYRNQHVAPDETKACRICGQPIHFTRATCDLWHQLVPTQLLRTFAPEHEAEAS